MIQEILVLMVSPLWEYVVARIRGKLLYRRILSVSAVFFISAHDHLCRRVPSKFLFYQ